MDQLTYASSWPAIHPNVFFLLGDYLELSHPVEQLPLQVNLDTIYSRQVPSWAANNYQEYFQR